MNVTAYDIPNNYLNSNAIRIRLLNIGTKLSDFEEVENHQKGTRYTILGKGNFGYAEKMRSKKDNKYYAIKKLDKSNIKIKYFIRETEIMLNLNHENIVKFYGYFEDIEKMHKYKEINKDKKDIDKIKENKPIYCLVLEYIPNGNLNDYYHSYKRKFANENIFIPLSENFVIKIFKQLLSALIYLQSKSIVHRDIKPDNILFDECYNVKIGDFGLSALYKDENPENTNKKDYLFMNFSRVGRCDFVSPEVFKGQNYDYENDIYTLGLTMAYIMSYNSPIQFYLNNKTNKPLRKINSDNINKKYNINLQNLVKLMLKEDPKLRPNAQHAFSALQNIEKQINSKKIMTKNNSSNQFYKKYQITEINNNKNISNNNFIQGNNGLKNVNQNFYDQKYQNTEIDKKNINKIDLNNQIAHYQGSKKIMNIDKNIDVDIYSQEVSLDEPKIKQPKNTSLICVIQCLGSCIKGYAKSKIKNQINQSLFLDVINFIDFLERYFSSNIKDSENFMKNVQIYRNKLSLKIKKFEGTGEISPKIIFYELFTYLNEDFKSNKIPWNNNIFNGLIEPTNFPKEKYPEIYQKISLFKNNFKSPFIDCFYFINLDLLKCPNCNHILNITSHLSYFISLPSLNKDKISNLIKDHIYKPHNDNKKYIKCNKCSNNSLGKKEKVFFSTPQYLMINFTGDKKNEKILDDIINVSPYIVTNIGPKAYCLYAFITKEKNEGFCAYIRNKENNWNLYKNIDTVEKIRIEPNHNFIPNIAIYKSIN